MKPQLNTYYQLQVFRNGILWKGRASIGDLAWEGILTYPSTAIKFNVLNTSKEKEEYKVDWIYDVPRNRSFRESLTVSIDTGETACFTFDLEGLNCKILEKEG